MEDNKYYAPEEEEFHKGFEYERYESHYEYHPIPAIINPDGSETIVTGSELVKVSSWRKNVYDGTDFTFADDERIEVEFSAYKVRVKYLDRDDIESFGFSEIEPKNSYSKCYVKGKLMLMVSSNYMVSCFRFSAERGYSDWTKMEYLVFSDLVPNKSELKRLFKKHKICQ